MYYKYYNAEIKNLQDAYCQTRILLIVALGWIKARSNGSINGHRGRTINTQQPSNQPPLAQSHCNPVRSPSLPALNCLFNSRRLPRSSNCLLDCSSCLSVHSDCLLDCSSQLPACSDHLNTTPWKRSVVSSLPPILKILFGRWPKTYLTTLVSFLSILFLTPVAV